MLDTGFRGKVIDMVGHLVDGRGRRRVGRDPIPANAVELLAGRVRVIALVGAIAGAGRRLSVRLGDGYRFAHVHAPAGADYVGFAPMTAPVNALVTGRGLRCVAPGERFRATFAVDVRGYPGRR